MLSGVPFTIGDRPLEIRALPFEESNGLADAVNVLTAEQQSQLRGIATLVSFRQRNELIAAEGTDASFVYLVVRGLVRISRCCEPGRQQVLAFMKQGDVFGLSQHGNYENTARSLGDVWVYRINWWGLQVLMQRDPSLRVALFARAVFDLRQAQRHILMLGLHNVTQRLAGFFLDLMKHEEFYDVRTHELFLPPCRFDLAEFLGTRPETVVRSMAWLEAKDFIRRKSARLLTIVSADGLEEVLNEARLRN